MENKCSLNSFVTGFTAGLASKDRSLLLAEELDWKIPYVFHEWNEEKLTKTINFRFNMPYYMYGKVENKHVYNSDLRNAFNNGTQRGLFVLDENLFRFTIQSSQEAELYLNSVPGDNKIWLNLAEIFLHVFPHQTR